MEFTSESIENDVGKEEKKAGYLHFFPLTSVFNRLLKPSRSLKFGIMWKKVELDKSRILLSYKE